MRGFQNFLDKHAKGSSILVLFVLTNVIYALMLLVTIPALSRFSEGMTIPDMMPTGYDHAYLQRLMQTLGKEGRRYYLTRQIPLDLLYPFLFGLTYSLMTAWAFKRFGAFSNKVCALALLPLIAALADYAENFGLIATLCKYPDASESLSQVSSAFTWIKSSSTALFFVFFLLALVFLSVSRIRKNYRSDKASR